MPGGFPIGPEICNGSSAGIVSSSSSALAVTGGTANNFGAWTQMIAATSFDVAYIVAMVSDQVVSNFNSVYDIGIGAAGNETPIVNKLMGYGGNGNNYNAYELPVSIPAGTRISVRELGGGSGNSGHIGLELFDAGFTNMEGGAGVDAVGFVAGTCHGTSVTTGAANTKGSYSQLVASAARDYLGFCVAIDGLDAALGVHGILDIAIGAAGSEQIIVPDWIFTLTTQGSPVSKFYAIPIPAGARVAARAQDITGAQSFGVTVYGVYK